MQLASRQLAALAFDPSLFFTLRDWKIDAWQRHLLRGHTSQVNTVAFSPDGQTLASGCDSGRVRLWDVKTGQEKMVLGGNLSGIRCVAFSPDGKTLASASNDKSIRLWDIPGSEQKDK